MSAAEFTCEHCGSTFPKGRSDEEAQAEADELWGDDLIDPVVVCDDCFQWMTAWKSIPDYIAETKAEPESASDIMQRMHAIVDEHRASLTPLERIIHDELSRAYTDLLLYGQTTITRNGHSGR